MTVAEFMSPEEARELNLVARLTTDDYYQIGKMRTTAFTWLDIANERPNKPHIVKMPPDPKE